MAVMQVSENDTAILYYSDLRGHWPDERAARFLRALAYGKRLATDTQEIEGRRTLAGVSLSRRALSAMLGREVAARGFVFPDGGKPHVPRAPDFSIAHSGHWVGCAVAAAGRVGFDVEVLREGIERAVRVLCKPEEALSLTAQTALARWVATEAALKAHGASVREARDVEFHEGRAFFRGEPLFGIEVDVFEGAAACVMTSQPVRALEVVAVSLEELF
jgi:hypothetical protein